MWDGTIKHYTGVDRYAAERQQLVWRAPEQQQGTTIHKCVDWLLTNDEVSNDMLQTCDQCDGLIRWGPWGEVVKKLWINNMDVQTLLSRYDACQ